ncbi:magnetosome-associated protein MamJ-like [Penaeus japonicus]|uniref:magnetosome-associated protein MamJ-like n=1 Tax=Penaeus japonicus TaxID=27405 RepID=UPI001C70CFCB|nr:magnetosome-associated protein MamJ-like [Penaeus japonicus]
MLTSPAVVLLAALLAAPCTAAPDRKRPTDEGYYQFTTLDDLGLPVLSFVSTSPDGQVVITDTPLVEGQVSGASGTAKPDESVVDETVEGVPIGIPAVPVGEVPIREGVPPRRGSAPVRDVLVEVPAGEVALVNITVVQIPAGGVAAGAGPVRDVPTGAAPVVVSSPEGVPVEASVVGAPIVALPSVEVAPEGVPVEGSVAVVDPTADETPVEAVVVEAIPDGAVPGGEQPPADSQVDLPARDVAADDVTQGSSQSSSEEEK